MFIVAVYSSLQDIKQIFATKNLFLACSLDFDNGCKDFTSLSFYFMLLNIW